MKIHLLNIINYLAVFTVIADVFTASELIPYFELRGSYFILPVVLTLCIMMSGKLFLSRNFVIIFGIIILFSVYSILVGNTSIVLFSKSLVGILLNSLTFYMVFKLNDGDVKKLFLIYLNLAFIVALIGIAQEINNVSSLLPSFGRTIPLGGTNLYKVTSIFPEPAHFCTAMIPAFFASSVSVIQSYKLLQNWKSWVIIAAFLLSFSAVGYFGILLTIVLIAVAYNKIKYLLLGTILVPLFLIIVYVKVYEIRWRVNDTIEVITGKKELLETNYSTFSLVSNTKIGFISFQENPVFGGGLGSHRMSYFKNIYNVIGVDLDELERRGYILLNVEDAGSLFVRLLSETGLLGLIALLTFFIVNYIKMKNDKSRYLWIINNAVLVFLLLKLLRDGHYFIYGTFLFFWAYYFSHKKYLELMEKEGSL